MSTSDWYRLGILLLCLCVPALIGIVAWVMVRREKNREKAMAQYLDEVLDTPTGSELEELKTRLGVEPADDA